MVVLKSLKNLLACVPLALAVTLALGAMACGSLFLMPQTLYALDTASLSAEPNSDSTSDVLGGTETRVTWDVQAAPDEDVKELDLTLPEGTGFEVDNARVTMLSGEDLMDRTMIYADVAKDGQTVKVP